MLTYLALFPGQIRLGEFAHCPNSPISQKLVIFSIRFSLNSLSGLTESVLPLSRPSQTRTYKRSALSANRGTSCYCQQSHHASCVLDFCHRRQELVCHTQCRWVLRDRSRTVRCSADLPDIHGRSNALLQALTILKYVLACYAGRSVRTGVPGNCLRRLL